MIKTDQYDKTNHVFKGVDSTYNLKSKDKSHKLFTKNLVMIGLLCHTE